MAIVKQVALVCVLLSLNSLRNLLIPVLLDCSIRWTQNGVIVVKVQLVGLDYAIHELLTEARPRERLHSH